MSDMELIKAAQKELGDEATLAQVVQWVEAKKALDAVTSGEEPGAEPAEPTAASAEPAEETTVEASAEPAEPTELELPAEPAAEGMAEAALQSVADAAGVDLAAVLAAMEERPGDFAAVVSGAPADGTVADEDAAMGAIAQARVVDLTKKITEHTEAATKMTARVAELEAMLLSRDIEQAAERGHILDTERDTLKKFARTSPAQVRERLAEAEEAPAVPRGKRVKASRPRGKGFEAPDAADEKVAAYVRAGHSQERALELVATADKRIEQRRTRRA